MSNPRALSPRPRAPGASAPPRRGGPPAPGGSTPRRCRWAVDDDLVAYHDAEWGVPVHDDRRLFEMIVLEGAQAGLSWSTILRKRAGYRSAFDGFDPAAVARYGERQVRARLGDPGIVRNELKVRSAIANARALLEVSRGHGSFDAWIWRFVGGAPIQNAWKPGDVPARTAEAEAMSAALVERGFKFVGPTICYAFMQAVGMVNDHTTDCFRHQELAARRPARSR